MREDIDPVQWAGQQAVVALPEHMDASNAGQIREELLSVINGGATALIADMTATTSCDHAVWTVVRTFQRAVLSGTELRLVVTAEHVSRVLSLSGLDHLAPHLPIPGSGHSRQRAGGGARRGGRAGAWWQQIMGGSTVGLWAIATFVSGTAARARRAGRWSTWLCRSSVVR